MAVAKVAMLLASRLLLEGRYLEVVDHKAINRRTGNSIIQLALIIGDKVYIQVVDTTIRGKAI